MKGTEEEGAQIKSEINCSTGVHCRGGLMINIHAYPISQLLKLHKSEKGEVQSCKEPIINCTFYFLYCHIKHNITFIQLIERGEMQEVKECLEGFV